MGKGGGGEGGGGGRGGRGGGGGRGRGGGGGGEGGRGGGGGGGQIEFCQYADDATGFMADLSQSKYFYKWWKVWFYATGDKLNEYRCIDIWLGKCG